MSTALPASPQPRINRPALFVVLFGVVAGGAIVIALPFMYAEAAFGVLAASLALFCALQATGPARLVVGATTLLSVYSTALLISPFASRFALQNGSWPWLVLTGLCTALLVQLYLYLAARAFAPAGTARRWRRLLVAAALLNIAGAGLILLHDLLPCSALDVARRLGGCRALLHVSGRELVVAAAPGGTTAASVASMVEPRDPLARR
jgi:hypothetical protein